MYNIKNTVLLRFIQNIFAMVFKLDAKSITALSWNAEAFTKNRTCQAVEPEKVDQKVLQEQFLCPIGSWCIYLIFFVEIIKTMLFLGGGGCVFFFLNFFFFLFFFFFFFFFFLIKWKKLFLNLKITLNDIP